MRMLTVTIVAGALALTAAPLAASAGQPAQAQASSIRLAAVDGPAADRESYTRKADDDVQAWQRKVHDFGERAEVKGKEARKATLQGLEAAWDRTQAEGRNLRTATADGWQAARLSFERASHDLSEAWDRAVSDGQQGKPAQAQ
jgi:hypothetical protein